MLGPIVRMLHQLEKNKQMKSNKNASTESSLCYICGDELEEGRIACEQCEDRMYYSKK